MDRTPAEHHAQRISRGIELTMENIVRTNNCIAFAVDNKLKARMRERNERRMFALEQMQRSLQALESSRLPPS